MELLALFYLIKMKSLIVRKKLGLRLVLLAFHLNILSSKGLSCI